MSLTGSRRPCILAVALVAAILALGGVRIAAAHPLGNFTTNQYVRIEVLPGEVRLVYVLDLAEISAFQEIMERIDGDGDGDISAAEEGEYLDAKLAEILGEMRLEADGAGLPLGVVERAVAFPDGQAGLRLVRLRATLTAPLPLDATARDVTFRLDYGGDRPGWREVVVTHAAGVALSGSDTPERDVSDELRAYPDDLLGSPLDRTTARFTAAASPGAAAAASYAGYTARAASGDAPGDGTGNGAGEAGSRPGGGSSGDRFAALLDGDDLTATGIAVAIGLAMVWGGAHALSPGHGKTVVGAYLVGSRGTPRHAVFLGLTVTLTHTAGVVALGLVTLGLSRYVLPEQLYPWMSLVSGLLVLGMGLILLAQRAGGSAGRGFGQRVGIGHSHGPDGEHEHAHGPGGHDHGHEDAHLVAHTHDHHHGNAQHHHDDGHRVHHHDHHDHDHAAAHAHGLVHSHGPGGSHSHLPPGAAGEPVRWRSLVALGISGGLVPCPSALVVLLGAIALGQVGFGLVLVTAFSLGLAAALTAVGLMFLYARRFLERRTGEAGGRFPGLTGLIVRYAPALSALGVTVAGVVIVLRALGETRFP